ncbi:hypothetical protein FD754_007474 [Muntiacus muntjak]|uniref:Uncharacterized protein n=1 Tax=Muntiacus muntjak TaxID=9888 RepID=A0A5N3WR70_MUNMU|nr:hypothetical protein FD754_007474 [Muntiacus muntjak]
MTKIELAFQCGENFPFEYSKREICTCASRTNCLGSVRNAAVEERILCLRPERSHAVFSG